MGYPVAKEDIFLDQIVVPMTQSQRALRLEENISSQDVGPRLARDYFHFTVTSIEVIFLHCGKGVTS